MVTLSLEPTDVSCTGTCQPIRNEHSAVIVVPVIKYERKREQSEQRQVSTVNLSGTILNVFIFSVYSCVALGFTTVFQYFRNHVKFVFWLSNMLNMNFKVSGCGYQETL